MSLLVVGALHWDVVVRAERLPRLDETLRGSEVDYRLGGKGGNQAIAAARAGAEVAFCGRIGADEAGASMRAALAAAGIDLGLLQTGTGASGMSVAITDAAGEYGAVIVSGENLSLVITDLSTSVSTRILLIQNELTSGLLLQVSEAATASGMPLWLNAAPADGIAAEVLDRVDVLIVNRVEGADLAGETAPEQIVPALQLVAPKAHIVMTLGPDGVVFAEPGGSAIHYPAMPVDVVSSHGAGDVFVGHLAAMRLADLTWDAAIEAAQKAAAAHISQTR